MAPTMRVQEGANELLKNHFRCTTDAEVAERLGINASTWSRAIRGIDEPGRKLRKALLKIDALRPDQLLAWCTPDTPATPERESA